MLILNIGFSYVYMRTLIYSYKVLMFSIVLFFDLQELTPNQLQDGEFYCHLLEKLLASPFIQKLTQIFVDSLCIYVLHAFKVSFFLGMGF